MHHSFVLYIGLLLVILFLVMLAQRLKISSPIILVIGGLAISFVPGLEKIEIDPELIFLIFLPPLLYEAAWHTSWKDFWKWRRIIASFAFLIVLLTSCVIAYTSIYIIPGFTLALGFLLGGIISPPDAVAATSILRSVKVPKRLITIIEGESLLNDASSLIVFRFAIAAIVSGHFVFREAATSFFVVISMGTITGLLIGLLFYAIHRWLPTTPSMDTVLTFVAPYVMYITAEAFHFSGVLAVVCGGLFMSSQRQIILSHISRIQGVNVWDTVGFVLNGLVFMLIGLELRVIVTQLGDTSLAAAITYSIIISLIVIIARLLCALGASAFTVVASKVITTADNAPGWRLPLIFGWAGMRGVVSLASALSIPLFTDSGQAFPQRNLILFITFFVILVTLVFQGLTLPLVVRWLHMKDPDYALSEEEQDAIIRNKMAKAALTLLHNKYNDELHHNKLLQSLRLKMESDVDGTSETSVPAIHSYKAAWQDLIEERRALLNRLNREEGLEEELIRKHQAQLDMEEEKLKQQMG